MGLTTIGGRKLHSENPKLNTLHQNTLFSGLGRIFLKLVNGYPVNKYWQTEQGRLWSKFNIHL